MSILFGRMRPQGRSLNPFRVLVTHRNFRLFWTGQTLSLIGSWMQTMALGWLSLQLSCFARVVQRQAQELLASCKSHCVCTINQ